MIETTSRLAEALAQLAALPHSQAIADAPLAAYTRFAIGGPAALLFDTHDEASFVEALRISGASGLPRVVVGGGTNLIVSDAGFPGIVLRYRGSDIEQDGLRFTVASGAVLQSVVDRSIAGSLRGLETMTGIPGSLGGAVYGNAGAYGHSIQELVRETRAFDGARIIALQNDACDFAYRTSIFKQHKDWIILSTTLEFREGDAGELSKTAADIRTVRDAKYPPAMRCAGSIFKNLLVKELPANVQTAIPPAVIREGKMPSAWFLEQVGAKGMRRGDIQVATYHANLIYNDGAGTASDLVSIIRELKERVADRFGFELAEEVQYVGFDK